MPGLHSTDAAFPAGVGCQSTLPSRWAQRCNIEPVAPWPCSTGAGAAAASNGGCRGCQSAKDCFLQPRTRDVDWPREEWSCEDRRVHDLRECDSVPPIQMLRGELEEQPLPPSPREKEHVVGVSLDAELRHCISTMDEKLDQLAMEVSRCLDAIKLIHRPPQHVAGNCHYATEGSTLIAGEDLPTSSLDTHTQTRRKSLYQVMDENPLDLPIEYQTSSFRAYSKRMSATSFVSSSVDFLRGRKRSELAEQVWIFLDDPTSSRCATLFGQAWVFIVWVSVLFTLAQTVEPPAFSDAVRAFVEIAFDVLFLIELFIRFAVRANIWGFLSSPYNVFDILAVAPLVLRAAFGFVVKNDQPDSVRFIFFCCVPVLRLLKLLRRFQLFNLFLRALTSASEALRFLLFLMLVVLLVFSSCLYLVEPRSNIDTLPTAMWFTIVTMTTVGYGDLTPESSAGHGIVSVLMVGSVLYMAMPIGIIGNAFTQVWSERDQIQLASSTRARLVEWGYTTSDIPKLFRHFDHNRNGELTLREFRELVDFLHVGLKGERVVELFELLDKDGGGSIDYWEFMRRLFPSTYHELNRVTKATPNRPSQTSGGNGAFG